MKVFLGGTCNGSTWRNEMKDKLRIEYIIPEEIDDIQKEKEKCDFCLYVITPRFDLDDIAEVINESNIRPKKTIFCYLEKDICDNSNSNEKNFELNKGWYTDYIFSNKQIQSLDNIGQIVRENGGIFCDTLNDVILYINTKSMLRQHAMHEIIYGHGNKVLES